MCGQLDGIDNEGVLAHSLLGPGATNIGRAVVQDQVEGDAAVLGHEGLDPGPALGLGDVLLDGEGATYWRNGDEVDAKYEAADGYALDRHLHPASGGCAEIKDRVR